MATPTTTCPACHRRDPEPEDGRVCGPCQRWLPVALRSIVDKTGDLADLIDSADRQVDDRWYWHEFPRRRDPVTGVLLPVEGEWRRSEPLTVLGGAGLVPGEHHEPRVSGSRDPSAPLPLGVLDLLGPVVRDGGIPVDSISPEGATKVPKLVPGDDRQLTVRELRMIPVRDPKSDRIVGEQLVESARTSQVTERRYALRNHDDQAIAAAADRRRRDGTYTPESGRGDGDPRRYGGRLPDRRWWWHPPYGPAGEVVLTSAGDQTGNIPVAAVLDQEARAWADAGAPGSRWRPVPTVDRLADWLTRRLPWACDRYEPIGDFTATIRQLRGRLMAVLGEFDPEPEPCDGVPCNRCDLRLLFRRNDGTGDVDCHNPDCRKVFRADEYTTWVKHEGSYQRSLRDPGEVTELLRPTYRRTADTPA